MAGSLPEEDVGEARLTARAIGRKMPAPGTEVVKYLLLLGW